ncbi:hypothetical protein D3C86_1559210 [compost metagenome]
MRIFTEPDNAELPDKTEAAPLITSTWLMFSTGMKPHSGLPASPESIGISSTNTATLEPTPKVNPLPPRIWGSPSRIFNPGVWSSTVSILRVFLLSIKRGFKTSIETV